MRWTSPALQDDPEMAECPTGYILREARWAWDVIDMANRVESCSPREWSALPRWFQHAARLVLSERERMRRAEEKQREDARHG